MPKILIGRVVSTKMKDTVVVNVTTARPHPIYKKRLKRDRRIKAAVFGELQTQIKEGDFVKIMQTRPISKQKHFKVIEAVK